MSKKKKSLSTFEEFEQGMKSVKFSVSKMAKIAFDRLFPGPLWQYNIDDLTKSKAMLEELIKYIEKAIEGAEKLAKQLRKTEHSEIISENTVLNLNLVDYPKDFTIEVADYGYLVTRKKYV